MAIRADRAGVRQDQVDIHGRVTSPSFLNELLEDLPEWTDMPVWVNGTEELLPSNNSVPVTSPILTDIAYPDIRRDNQYFTYRESPTPVDGLAKIKSIKGNTLVWNQFCCKGRYFTRGNNEWRNTFTENGVTFTYLDDYTVRIAGTPTARACIYANRLDNTNYPVNQGEKLLLRCSNTPNGIDIFSSLYLDNTWKGTGPQKSDKYFTVPSDVNKLVCMGIDVQASLIGQTIDITVSLNIFNLTKMFGSGNEPTEEEFNALFPIYYSYNAGTLLSFNGTGIKTANADETEEHTTNLPVSTYFPNGMKSAGTVYDELTPTKAIIRIGELNIDSSTTIPTWESSDGWTANIELNGYKPNGAVKSDKFDYIGSFNGASSFATSAKARGGYCIGTLQNGNRLYFYSSTASTSNDLINAIRGTNLYYELATPVELPTMSFE